MRTWTVLWMLCVFAIGVGGGARGAESGLPGDHEALGEAEDEMDLVVVEAEPPAALEEDPDESPSDGAVWLKGYWRWNPRLKKHEWVRGVWREAPEGLVWHAGHWKRTDKGWVWINGHWGKPDEKDLVVATTAPPPLKVEARPPKPGTNYVWIAGHWKWNGAKYVWAKGTWRATARSGSVWVKGHYRRRPTGYVYVPGHWDYRAQSRVARRPLSPKRVVHPRPVRARVRRPVRARRR